MSILNIAIVTLTFFFGSTPPRQNNAFAVQAPDVQQPYSWGGASGDLSVNLWLVRDRDSVYARGTYDVASTKKVGCGGQSLFPKGRVTMRAKGNFEAFTGKLLFDTGWTPPFSAKKTSATTMTGTIRSINHAASCKLPLHRVAPVWKGPR
jgi:hypothetical protein